MEGVEGPGVQGPTEVTVLQAMQQQIVQLQAAMQQMMQQQPAVVAQQPAATVQPSRMKLPKPPETNGKQPTPINWCHRMETYLQAQGADLNSSATVAYAAAFLKDAALTWYRQYEQDVAKGHQTPFSTWRQFKEAFISRFTPIDPTETAREQLDKLVQTRSVYQYAQDFNTCMLELPEMHEADRVHSFIKGLKPAVRTHVKLQKPATLHDAVELAIKADSTVWQSSRNFSSTRAFGSNGSGSRGSNVQQQAATPMELGMADLDAMQQTSGNFPQQQRTSQRQPQRQKPVAKCFYCGKPGHLKRQCQKLLRDQSRRYEAAQPLN